MKDADIEKRIEQLEKLREEDSNLLRAVSLLVMKHQEVLEQGEPLLMEVREILERIVDVPIGRRSS